MGFLSSGILLSVHLEIGHGLFNNFKNSEREEALPSTRQQSFDDCWMLYFDILYRVPRFFYS
jgi:hypothetical protein